MNPRSRPIGVGDACIAIREMSAPWLEQRHMTVMWALACRLPTIRPSQSTLADNCKMSRNAVCYTLAELREHGVITFDGGKTKGKRITYSLVMPAILALGAGVTPAQPMGTSPSEPANPMGTYLPTPWAPPAHGMGTAKSQGKIQPEGDPERAQGSPGAGPARKGGRPPLPSLPASSPRPCLQPLPPRRPLRACPAPVLSPDAPGTPKGPPGTERRQEGAPAAVG